jgi:hypothetical protein
VCACVCAFFFHHSFLNTCFAHAHTQDVFARAHVFVRVHMFFWCARTSHKRVHARARTRTHAMLRPQVVLHEVPVQEPMEPDEQRVALALGIFDESNCEWLLGDMREHDEDPTMQARALMLIGCSCGASQVNRDRFGTFGACEVAVSALKKFGTTNAYVAKEGCRAISSLCADTSGANQYRVAACGGCEAVVGALKAFGTTNPDVAKQGCNAIANLCNLSFTNKELVGECGGCEVVVSAMKEFGTTNAEVAQHGCGAIFNLSALDANKDRIGECGGCEAAVNTLKTFGATHSDVSWNGCAAIVNLCFENPANKQRFQLAGAKAVVGGCCSNVCKDWATGEFR